MSLRVSQSSSVCYCLLNQCQSSSACSSPSSSSAQTKCNTPRCQRGVSLERGGMVQRRGSDRSAERGRMPRLLFGDPREELLLSLERADRGCGLSTFSCAVWNAEVIWGSKVGDEEWKASVSPRRPQIRDATYRETKSMLKAARRLLCTQSCEEHTAERPAYLRTASESRIFAPLTWDPCRTRLHMVKGMRHLSGERSRAQTGQGTVANGEGENNQSRTVQASP